MRKIASTHKARFRAAYVRYRELRLELQAARSALQRANVVKWGATAVLALWLVRMALGNDWPDLVVGLALLFSVGGWAHAGDKRKRLEALHEEWQSIRQVAQESGAYISDSLDQVKVYVGEVKEGNIVDPLSEAAYE